VKRRILGGLAFSLLLLPACTAVLGMEDAKLDESIGAAATGGGGAGGRGGTTGSGGTSSRLPPTIYPEEECDTPQPNCVQCLSGCGRGECLEASECRKSLYAHRSCLDTSCADMNSQCANQHLGSSGDSTTQKFHLCLSDACADECAVGSVATLCELYCRCMAGKCATKVEAGPTCMDDCSRLDPDAVYCRWIHCEAASATNQQHCDHAVGLLGHCPRSTPGNTCNDKIHSGFPCTRNEDCCSNACRTEVCQ
jgi:hypothetical protein